MAAEPGHDHGHDHGQPHGFGLGARILGWLRPHSHVVSEQIDPTLERSAEGIRATKLGLLFLGVSSAIQLVIALFAGSVALFADMVHNVADAGTSIPLWIAFALGNRARTRSYGYGYRRAEDLAGLFIAVVIALSAVLVAWESIDRLIDPRPMEHLWWVLVAGVVGVVGNELAAVVRIRTGRRIGSPALIADGFHARTDTMASLAVIVAALATWGGLPIVDPLVGLLIAGLILWILKETSTELFRRLLDGVDESTLVRLEDATAEVDGVLAVDGVRARWTGHRLLSEIAIQVPATLTVAEGHEIADRVHRELLAKLSEVEDVHVHVNPLRGPGGD